MVQAEHDRHGQRKVRRGLLALVLAVAQLLVVGTASEVAQAAVPAGSSQYVALTPFRLTDTRPHAPFGYSAINHNTIRINITGKPGVPANATAAVINITLINSSGPGYISAFPSGSSVPNTSNVNADKAGQVIANLAHVRIGAGGNIDVLRSMGAYIAVDLVGVYVPVASDASSGRLVTLATGAKRVLDTRQRGYPVGANLVTGVDLTAANVPTTASAVVVNVTAVGAQKGFWTAYAAGAVRPEVSSLNVDTAGQTRPAQAIVPLNGNSSIYVYTQFGGHLLVDVVGWYTGASDVTSSNGLFIAAPTPLRVFDTRTLRTLAPWGNSTYEFTTGQAPTLPVAAVAMNVTGTSPWDRGFVTAHPAGVPQHHRVAADHRQPLGGAAQHPRRRAVHQLGVAHDRRRGWLVPRPSAGRHHPRAGEPELQPEQGHGRVRQQDRHVRAGEERWRQPRLHRRPGLRRHLERPHQRGHAGQRDAVRSPHHWLGTVPVHQRPQAG